VAEVLAVERRHSQPLVPGEIAALLDAPNAESFLEIARWAEQAPREVLLAALPELERRLSAWPGHTRPAPPEWVTALFSPEPAPVLALLHSVSVTAAKPGLGPSEVAALARNANLAWVRGLDLACTQIGSSELEALVLSPLIERLARLDLSDCQIDDTWPFSMSPYVSALECLVLSGNPLGRTGIVGLARSPWLTSLRELELSRAVLDAGAVRELGLARLPALRRFSCHASRLGEEAGLELARCGWLRQLTSLDLSNNRIGDTAFSAIIRRLPAVRELELANVGLTDQGAERLLHLPTLERVELGGNDISPPMLARLGRA
jgi:hypothetical protein